VAIVLLLPATGSQAEGKPKPPPAPTIHLVKDYVTGKSGALDATRYRELRLEGIARGDAKSVTVHADGRVIAEAKVRGDSRWSATSRELDPGKHVLKAVATNKTGMTSAPSERLKVVVTDSPGRVDLARLDGLNGAELWVQNFYDECMDRSVASGDFNGDGLSDAVIGGSRLTSAVKGPVLPAILGVFGTTDDFKDRVNMPALPMSKAIWVTGTERMRFEYSQIVGAGDMNGDGIDDLAIALPASDVASHPYGGRVAVIYGRSPGYPAPTELASLAPESGFEIVSDRGQGALGGSIAPAGDVNGDGLADLLVGSNLGAYLVFGERGTARKTLHTDRLVPKDAITFSGNPAVRAGGDVNGDRFSDIILSSGDSVYVIYGGEALPSKIDLKDVAGKRGFVLSGAADIGAGSSAATGFDLNDDGVDDLALSTTDPGRPGYIIFGQKGEKRRDIDLDRMSQRDGFALRGEFRVTRIGAHMAAGGDVNGDGVDDLLFGTADGVGLDIAYVVFGRGAVFPRILDMADFDGQDGFRIVMSRPGRDDRIGCSLVGAGDVNGDGVDDILISGDSSRDPDDRESSAYLLFGRKE
jgi:hypothetical protein